MQNDYFPGGKFPLWNTENTLKNILGAIKICQEKNYPVIIIQHIADPNLGLAPFFVKDTDELLVCGMMTQNCVTHTAISNKKSKDYKTSILMDACTTVSEPIHLIALHAASTWVPLISYKDIH